MYKSYDVPKKLGVKWPSGVGCQPKITQTDHGFEFTHFHETKRIPRLIDIATEKASHTNSFAQGHRDTMGKWSAASNDNERFDSRLSFYSYEDLLVQRKRYLYKSNRLPMRTLQ